MLLKYKGVRRVWKGSVTAALDRFETKLSEFLGA
jgi:hypothetical protein